MGRVGRWWKIYSAIWTDVVHTALAVQPQLKGRRMVNHWYVEVAALLGLLGNSICKLHKLSYRRIEGYCSVLETFFFRRFNLHPSVGML
jgi:hypothetical protein